MLAGDAAGFIDPVFSSGVFLALLAGEQCADILDIVLDHPRQSTRDSLPATSGCYAA